MSWVDYCIIGIVALSMVVGFLRGFIREVLGSVTWIAAFALAWFFGASVAHILAPYIHIPAARLVAGYTLMFFLALFAGSLLTYLIESLIQNGGGAGIDRTLGAGFGLLRGVLAVVVIIMLAGTTTAHQERWWRESRLIPPLVPLADTLRSWVPERWLEPLKSQPVQQQSAVPAGRL
jgi:membrane protein required for colicin V production